MKEKNFIFGIRTVIEAVEAGKNIDKVLLKSNLQGELIHELTSLIRQHNIPFQYVPGAKIDSFTQKNHQGVIAFISPIEFVNIEQIVPFVFEQGRTPFFLMLDQISDVRNFGAIVRSAECAGVDAIIIPDKGAAQINADAVKTSAGALHHVSLCKVSNLKKCVQFLQNSGIQAIAVTEKTETFHYQLNYTAPTLLIFGAEDIGISNDLLRIVDSYAKIPILGQIGSLNVSVAAGVVMYEVIRQRGLELTLTK
jgi:23S rRNA (guanosine2251-2'-O)-methyltransferase